MVNHITLYAAALVSSLALSGVALAADTPKASVSGPANGTNVEPSAAVQKEAVESQTEGRSVFYKPKLLPFGMLGGGIAAGAPGTEGAFGAQSGR
jgi:hypothetical protein